MNTTVQLTKREFQVAELLAWGAAKKEVPQLLPKRNGHEISVQTVEVITKKIYAKLAIQKVSELAVWYFCMNYHISLDLSPLKRKIVTVVFLLLVGTAEALNSIDFVRPCAGRTVGRTAKAGRSGRRKSDSTFELEL
jgi:DNA-binding CsgD family transcriptional regulator